MNKKQIIIILIVCGVIGVQFLFPQWASLEFVDTDQGQVLYERLEYRFINNPPEHSEVKEPFIRWRYMAQRCAVIIVVAGVLCFFLRTKKVHKINESEDKPSSNAAF